MRFICRYCGDELETGDPGNVDHCIGHIGRAELDARIRRMVDRERANERAAEPAGAEDKH